MARPGAHAGRVTVLARSDSPRDPSAPLTLGDLAAAIPDSSEERRWRLLQEFLRGYGATPVVERRRLIVAEPARVDPPWDALLAGVAEHLAFHDRLELPGWVGLAGRSVMPWWFPGTVDADGRSARLASAPAALAVRGVWLDRTVFDRAGVPGGTRPRTESAAGATGPTA